MTVRLRRLSGVIALLTIGCGGASDQAARARHAREFDCSSHDVSVTPQGDLWNAKGCGHEATYECTRDAMETRCVMVTKDGKER